MRPFRRILRHFEFMIRRRENRHARTGSDLRPNSLAAESSAFFVSRNRSRTPRSSLSSRAGVAVQRGNVIAASRRNHALESRRDRVHDSAVSCCCATTVIALLVANQHVGLVVEEPWPRSCVPPPWRDLLAEASVQFSNFQRCLEIATSTTTEPLRCRGPSCRWRSA